MSRPQAMPEAPDNADDHVALADLDAAAGRQEQAIGRYRCALAIQPGHPAAVIGLGALLRARGLGGQDDYESAIEVCRASIAILPDPAPAQALLGRLLLAAHRPVEAVEAFSAALALSPNDVAVCLGLAQAQLGAGQSEAALRAAGAVLTVAPSAADAWYVRGAALNVLRQHHAAATAFERGVALEPDRVRMRLGLAEAYGELDRTAEALVHLFQAVALDPGSAAAQSNLGSMLWRRGELEAAERHCRLALEIDPALVAAHQNLAGVYGDMGDAPKSRHHRDTAYGLCNLFVERAARPEAVVLILTTADSGNIPHKHLLPSDRYTRLDWFIEYAREDQADELPAYDVVFNIIGDPDYADATEAPVAAFLKVCDRPALNDPAHVYRTRRDRLPDLLSDIPGLVMPRTVRLAVAAVAAKGLAACAAEANLAVPLLIRPIGSHGGRGLILARTLAELEAFEIGGAEGVYLTEFRDFSTPSDGLYRKYRMIFVDRTPYPYHLAIANDWLVHYASAEMVGATDRQAEERRFLADPRAVLGDIAMDAIAAVGERLDLDYAGVDFSVLPDGRVLVFEANATMLVHPDEGEFAYKNPYVEAITGAFQALVARRMR